MELYVEVPSWWSECETRMEPSGNLCVPSTFVFAYYSGYVLHHTRNPIQVEAVWNIVGVQMVAFTPIQFIRCARDGIGARSQMDLRIVTEGCGILTHLTAGVASAIETMGFFQLVEG